jgi:hypothetical protein
MGRTRNIREIHTKLLWTDLQQRATVITKSVFQLGCGLIDPGFESRLGNRFFSSPNHVDRIWGPPSLIFNGHFYSFRE